MTGCDSVASRRVGVCAAESESLLRSPVLLLLSLARLSSRASSARLPSPRCPSGLIHDKLASVLCQPLRSST